MKTSLVIVFAVSYFLSPSLVNAIDEIGIQIASINLEKLNAKDVNVEFSFTKEGLTFSLTSPSISLPEPIGAINQLKLNCQHLVLFSEQVHCQKGVVQFEQELLGKQLIYFVITAQPNSEFYQIKLANVKYAGTLLDVDLKLHQQNWQLTAKTNQTSIGSVLHSLTSYLSEQQAQQILSWKMDGGTKIFINAEGAADQLINATIQADISELEMSEATGQYVAESVGAIFSAKLNYQQQVFKWGSNLTLNTGQAYAEPIFIDFVETPINITSQGNVNLDTHQLLIENIEFQHADVLTATVSYRGHLDLGGELSLNIQQASLNGLFEPWIHPFLVNTGIADLELTGDIALDMTKHQEKIAIKAHLFDVYVDDIRNRFGLYKLNGQLAWSNHNQPVESHFSWQGGYLYALPFANASVNAISQAQSFSLRDTLHLPLLDGAIDVEQFELFTPSEGEVEWSFKAELMPISMTDLTSSFGWPRMNGKLSGSIPKVSYRDHQIDIDGALKVNLFNGTTEITDLRLVEPFGRLPQLYANIDLKNIDLETLTSTFDFGKITGKLDGHITDLRLANWQPVAFNSAFYTPEHDTSRHRISQQAVNNLSEVSGGASGLLSRSFLGFFDNFSYKQLGISCQLMNEVCEMDGVKRAENGYYLVEGGGMPPQINVMGYTRRVNWPDLLARLKAVSNTEGIVVE